MGAIQKMEETIHRILQEKGLSTEDIIGIGVSCGGPLGRGDGYVLCVELVQILHALAQILAHAVLDPLQHLHPGQKRKWQGMDEVEGIWQGLAERYPVLEGCREDIMEAYHEMRESFARGGKLLICGNGGRRAGRPHIRHIHIAQLPQHAAAKAAQTDAAQPRGPGRLHRVYHVPGIPHY